LEDGGDVLRDRNEQGEKPGMQVDSETGRGGFGGGVFPIRPGAALKKSRAAVDELKTNAQIAPPEKRGG